MRTLRFIVTAQRVEADPGCDFSGLVPGTKGYLKARFTFSKEWVGCRKAASFWNFGKEYAALLVNNECEIPPEALTWKNFQVSVTGLRDGYRIKTNKVRVMQEG